MSLEPLLAEIGAASDGIVTTRHLRDAGIPPGRLQSLRRRGVLQPVARGVDKLRDHPLTWRTRARIALAEVGAGSSLARRTGGRLHAFHRYGGHDGIEVLVRRGGEHRSSTATVIETRWLPTEHLTVVDGLPVTTAARTYFDLCADPDGGMRVRHPAHRRAMESVYNDAIGRRGLTFAKEAAVLAALARRGRTGTRLVREILLDLGPEHAPAMSDVESLFLIVLRDHGVEPPVGQESLTDTEGWIGTVDFVWPAAGLVVEIDSAWHDGPLDRRRDAERDARLTGRGLRVLRYRFADLVGRPDAVVAEIRRHLHPV